MVSFRFKTHVIDDHKISALLHLSKYHNFSDLKVGDKCKFWVSLKPPVGLKNPGGFDYAKWLRYHRISATGYVLAKRKYSCEPANNYWLAKLRDNIERDIDASVRDKDVAAILSALSVGLRDNLSQSVWQVFQNTGTSHLVAISGLHIGLVSSVFFYLFNFLWRLVPKLLLFVPAKKIASLGAILGAVIYTSLSGFAVPAERALIMICCFMLGNFFNFEVVFYKRLLLALIVIGLIQPIELFSASFALSFFAVAILGFLLCARVKVAKGLAAWGRIQWSLFVGLIPLSITFFHQTSIVSMLANALAIPWIGFVIVPLVLLGVLVLICGNSFVACYIFKTSSFLLKPLWLILTSLAAYKWSSWHYIPTASWLWVLALIGVLVCLSPRGVPGRWLGCFGFLPLFFYAPKRPGVGEYYVQVLDVGQGLSVLVETKGHNLLYDAGSSMPDGLDMGETVVVPTLEYLGVKRLDKMIISHGDNDHSGGAKSVYNSLPVKKVISSSPRIVKKFNGNYCHYGQSWQWDGVNFEILSPEKGSPYQDNNSSCVLRISNVAGTALFTGDIEHIKEQDLVQQFGNKLRANLLIVPHHGSKTSSSKAFLKAVGPNYGVISLGAYDRYKFPSESVVDRYGHIGTKVYTTSSAGAISIRFLKAGRVILCAMRTGCL